MASPFCLTSTRSYDASVSSEGARNSATGRHGIASPVVLLADQRPAATVSTPCYRNESIFWRDIAQPGTNERTNGRTDVRRCRRDAPQDSPAMARLDCDQGRNTRLVWECGPAMLDVASIPENPEHVNERRECCYARILGLRLRDVTGHTKMSPSAASEDLIIGQESSGECDRRERNWGGGGGYGDNSPTRIRKFRFSGLVLEMDQPIGRFNILRSIFSSESANCSDSNM